MEFSNRAVYRVWQFWQAIKARPFTREDKAEIAEILNPSELELFFRQDISGQQHSVRVMRTLKEAGHDDIELLAAALLHDVGKAEVQSKWWDRPLVVLAQTLLPGRSALWTSGSDFGWNRPFVIKKCHPEWGAAAAAASGSSPVTVSLIRKHEEILNNEDEQSRENRLLALLQWADNQN
ncbi:MAG: HD domain-containing protein [Chloroflexota bacterium]|jgi:hypothetical protein